ncbi:cysteine desulfurase family protein [Enterococcus alishanensis]|uniref:Cysteine desulfurase n=1 Tax=Enterococcus alishanensis TaxID=1303817 RepID=A0ABS6T8K3_9ENTE|nr:cysteine desulfurase family protein [Enterococcus alishanensis]MBV7389226.1 cysteine desulfurase [Enterococcus alishanensis]
MEKIYLDHAATSPMNPQVIAEMTDVMSNIYGNPSSIHGIGREAAEKLMAARDIVAKSLAVKPHEIIFNSGGTEGDNTAILGVAFSRAELGKHIITTAIEHPAVMNTMKYLEDNGFEVTYLGVDKKGRISLDEFQAALREDTILVSVMYGNNEIGNLMPIKEIGEILADHPAYFHSDAVQAYGIETIRPHELGIDLLNISAHKINGPKGVGFLFKNDAIKLPALLRGGEQEEKRRAGTENIAGIAGLAKAVEILTPAEREKRTEMYQSFSQMILSALDVAEIPYAINGDLDHKLPQILNLRFKGVVNDLLLMKLDLKGVAVSTGSACTAGTVDPSHVLEAIYGKNAPEIKESVRFSFGQGNTEAQMSDLTKILVTSLQELAK